MVELWGTTLLPPVEWTVLFMLAGSGLGFIGLLIASQLKLHRGWDSAYSRKLFHVLIFSTMTLIHGMGGSWPVVNAVAAGIVFILLVGCFLGNGSHLYEAVARERDLPHRTLFILIPMACTALGGLLSNATVGDVALVGYLVTGWGDAAGEPFGRRFGRHLYRVPSLFGVPSCRSLEGSIAVGVASYLAAALAMGCAFGIEWQLALNGALIIAIVTILTEAFSHHGTDNLTTMVTASWVAAWWMA